MSLAQRLFGASTEPEPETSPERPDPDAADVWIPVPRDEMLTLVSIERRRMVLRILNDADGGVISMGSLADAVAADEYDKPADELTSKERKRVYVGLYQTHLPKLDDFGLVTVDERGSQVATTPLTEHAVTYLDVLDTMHGSDGDE